MLIGLTAWAILRSTLVSNDMGLSQTRILPARTLETSEAAEKPAKDQADGAAIMPVTAPEPRPSISFRVVDSEGFAVPSATVVLRIKGRPGTRSTVIRGSADADGLFAQTRNFPCDGDAITATVATVSGSDSRTHQFEVPKSLPTVWDLGNLALQASRTIEVHVSDSGGAPIPRAVILLEPRREKPVKTDSSGNARLAVPHDAETMKVSAPGFLIRDLEVPKDAVNGALEVVLDLACELTLSVVPLPSPDLRADISVTYASDESTRAYLQRNWPRSRASERSYTNQDGALVWRELPPNVALHAQVECFGLLIGSLEIAALQLGERRFEELRIEAVPQPLDVTIVGPANEPVANAWVEFAPLSGRAHFRSIRTDSQGWAEIAVYRPATVDVTVEAKGLATKSMYRVVVSEDSMCIQLERERVVEVQVFGMDGLPLRRRDGMVSASIDGGISLAGESIGEDRWRVGGLPAGQVVFIFQGKGSFEGWNSILHDTAVPVTKMVVGHVGRVYANFEVPDSMRIDRWAVTAHSLVDPTWSTRAFEARLNQLDKSVMLTGLPTGRHLLQLEFLSTSNPPVWTAWGGPATMEVGAEPVEVTLGR
ncbi:MAG TPA: carboxypeptidase-like regulatory domain-containing protein [Planctomycetota bacterium]|nr:carboxypeptidase-like regulatory domain-containing protein [Planctomycetota bacterium]